MATNHKIELKDITDTAMTSRVTHIPCTKTFIKNSANNAKCERMKQPAEQDAFFSWLAKGAQSFLTNGHLGETPQCCKDADTDFLAEQDTVRQWLSEGCKDTGLKNDVLMQSKVFGEYERWCDMQGITYLQKKMFFKLFKKHASGSEFKFVLKKSNGAKVIGLKFIDEAAYQVDG